MKPRMTQWIILFFALCSGFSYSQHLVIQAEAGTFSSGTKVEKEYSGYTGTGYVNTNNAVGAFIQLEFSVKNGGPDTIFAFYGMSKTDDRSAKVYINNALVVDSLAFPSTGAYTTWKSVFIVVNLAKGMNKVRFEARSANGLTNLDRFEISDEQGTMQYMLTTNISGKGVVSRSPDALYYDAGTVVSLTAVPDAASASVFTGWSGDLTGTELTKSITIDAAKTVTASFKATIHTNLYLAPTGNDATGDGSKANPFYSLQKAVDLINAGDTIYMAGGVYSYSARVNINKGGTAAEMITLRSAPGEHAILDFSSMADDDANQGIRLTGSYWHFYGFDIKGAGDNGLLIERNKPIGGTYVDIKDKNEDGHDNLIELCNFYENRDAGLQLKNLAAYNRIINCDSYYNRDATDGDADGFAPKLTVGTGNYFYGCRSWQNSDDGWDLYLKCKEDGFPQDMVTTMENCWTFMNGFYKDGTAGKGNGNGFKLGGSSGKDQSHNSILIRCLSFDNLQKGFDQNSNAGNMTLVNCTGFAKPYLDNSSHYTFRIDGTSLPSGKQLVATNCVSIGDGVTDRKKSLWAPCEMLGGVITTSDWVTAEADYVAIDTTGVRGPRKADGSLPDINFMYIKAGNTKLIDKGTLVNGVKFVGTAPDLGAFEYGMIDAIKDKDVTVKSFNLDQNYPNPFNPSTVISYQLTTNSMTTLKVYDVLGKVVATLVNEMQPAGSHQALFNATNLPSGLYLYSLRSGSFSETKKMLFIK